MIKTERMKVNKSSPHSSFVPVVLTRRHIRLRSVANATTSCCRRATCVMIGSIARRTRRAGSHSKSGIFAQLPTALRQAVWPPSSVCMASAVDLATRANLIIATFELSAVRLVRGAMLAADIASGRGQPASGLGPAPNPDIEPRRRITPEPFYEPRRHIHPAPQYEQRTILYSVHLEASLERQHNEASICGMAAVAPVASPAKSPFPPVWKTLPPVEHPVPARRPIKVIRHYPDIRNRGIVVDVHA